MTILANSSYLRYYSCVTDACAAPGPEGVQEGEDDTEEVRPGLTEWPDNGPM